MTDQKKQTLYGVFETDKTMEKDGVVLDFGVAKFTVRRAGGANRKYSMSFEKFANPHRKAMRTSTLAEEKQREIMLNTYYEAVIVSWEGVTDREGNVLEYNLHNFKMVMNDLPELWDTLRAECDNIRNFQKEEAEVDGEAVGNS